MNSSPMTMRMIELRMSSAPMIGPTVRTLRGSPAPNCGLEVVLELRELGAGGDAPGVGRLRASGSARRLRTGSATRMPLGLGDSALRRMRRSATAQRGRRLGAADGDGRRGDGGPGSPAGMRSIGSVRIRR